MGYILNELTARTGDSGMTSLANGTRVDKDSIRIEVSGALEELNSLLGMLMAKPIPAHMSELLRHVQNDLVGICSEVCSPGYKYLCRDALEQTDRIIENLNEGLPQLKEVILPGGSDAGALCHFARTVCRSTERRMVTLQTLDPIREDYKVPYLNRLADLLFALARTLNQNNGTPEKYWAPSANELSYRQSR